LYEFDARLVGHLERTVEQCRLAAKQNRALFNPTIHQRDFIEAVVEALAPDPFGHRSSMGFNRVIMNPPYRKIRGDSEARSLLRTVGIETGNLYTAFLALAVLTLEPGGELVAITPRSFCNGPYFRPFRQLFFSKMSLTRMHVFESRAKAFADDAVLQENVIFKAVKGGPRGDVFLSTSHAPGEAVTGRVVSHDAVVWPSDDERIVHLSMTPEDASTTDRMRGLRCTLADLGAEVSTGRVVDFRAKEYLRDEPSSDTVPLIYPGHFADGFVSWPKMDGRKPNALVASDATADLLVPEGVYTLAKRFTSKEERRRIVAAVYDPTRVHVGRVGFENHLNYFHCSGRGLDVAFARGLACFLNSSVVDAYFRQFSGHTQVNAADLRRLRYPSEQQLRRLAKIVGDRLSEQRAVDDAADTVLTTPHPR
jgi:adenine-specific DNA-methyltransferase